jgi:putative transposase
VVAEGVPHHITQRGNNRQDVFLLDDDRRYYLKILREKCHTFGLSVLDYCLMTNHVHLVALPECPASLAKALGQAHWPLLFLSVRADPPGGGAGVCRSESLASRHRG